jgi:hypothetical protein
MAGAGEDDVGGGSLVIWTVVVAGVVAMAVRLCVMLRGGAGIRFARPVLEPAGAASGVRTVQRVREVTLPCELLPPRLVASGESSWRVKLAVRAVRRPCRAVLLWSVPRALLAPGTLSDGLIDLLVARSELSMPIREPPAGPVHDGPIPEEKTLHLLSAETLSVRSDGSTVISATTDSSSGSASGSCVLGAEGCWDVVVAVLAAEAHTTRMPDLLLMPCTVSLASSSQSLVAAQQLFAHRGSLHALEVLPFISLSKF